MPLTLKTGVINYKDPTTGNYVEIDAVGDMLSETIAPNYDDLTYPVAAGKHCFHDGLLYAAKQDIQTTESWTASHWDEVTVTGQVEKKYEKPSAGIPSSDLADGVFDNIVAVQDTEPQNEDTKIWFPETQPQSVQVASYDELTALSGVINGKADENDLPVIPVFIKNENAWTCDTTFADVYAAAESKKCYVCEAVINGSIIYANLVSMSSGYILFSAMMPIDTSSMIMMIIYAANNEIQMQQVFSDANGNLAQLYGISFPVHAGDLRINIEERNHTITSSLYRAKVDISTPETFDSTKWEACTVADETSRLSGAIDAKPDVKDSTETGVDLDVSDENGNVIVRLKDGHIQTKNFDSSNGSTIKNSTKSGVDLDVSDPNGNVLMRLQNGHIQTKNFDSSNAGNMTCYVSPNGSDSNSGDSSNPFLTIQHAVDSGYNRIMLAPGEYKNQKVDIRGKHGISIICNTNQKENNLFESHKRQARAKLDNSIDVTGLTAYNSIYRTALSVDQESSYYKVFVSQTVDPVYSGSAYYGRVTTYNAILWEITDNILDCTRLIPKLTLPECEATAGSFFYDGDYLYVNPTSGSLTGVSYKRLNDDTFTSITKGFYVYNSTDIYIEGVDIQFYPYYGFNANLVSGLLMRDCGFFFTCYGSAAEFQNCNGDMWECNAAKAGADGFGIASGGNASFYNCNAVYCYDDGISHHDESTGIIDGGIWTYCKKGGVTPSFGSHVTVKNVIATHNVYGIYFPQSGDRITDGVQYMQNCLSVDNTTQDIKITGYNVVAHGCSYRTKEVDTGATLTEYNCTVIS